MGVCQSDIEENRSSIIAKELETCRLILYRRLKRFIPEKVNKTFTNSSCKLCGYCKIRSKPLRIFVFNLRNNEFSISETTDKWAKLIKFCRCQQGYCSNECFKKDFRSHQKICHQIGSPSRTSNFSLEETTIKFLPIKSLIFLAEIERNKVNESKRISLKD